MQDHLQLLKIFLIKHLNLRQHIQIFIQKTTKWWTKKIKKTEIKSEGYVQYE